MKIITIIGARPQFIKASVFSRATKKFNKNNSLKIEEIIVHTGQHYDYNMSESFFKELSIPEPKYNLDIGSKPHGEMTGEMLIQIEKVLMSEDPDAVLVYGDTNSTLAGALAAKKLKIKLIHIEAGLRSFNIAMPEEQNRILCDRVSDLLFCPTQNAFDQLKIESIQNNPYQQKAYFVGDVMFDSVLHQLNSIQFDKVMQRFGLKENTYYMATLHRGENTDDPNILSQIVEFLEYISEHKKIILPLHPRTKNFLKKYGLTFSKVETIDPVGYRDLLALVKQSCGVLTDSGGLQKEAYFLGKKCLTLRQETEWTELVDLGVNVLAGNQKSTIFEAYEIFRKIGSVDLDIGLYGDGKSGEKISEIISEELNF